jgi:predicted DNA-binding transcriptional regulator YafY
MVAQAKILRVLKLISILKSRSKTIKQIASTLEITERSVYRYLDLLTEVGFLVDKDFEDRYFIHVEEDEKSNFNFSTEESSLLKELISAGATNHPLKETLLKKLYLNSDLKSISRNLEKARLGMLVGKINEGITLQKQVVLKSYHSANSNEIKDRLVEPITLGELYDEVIAFDTSDRKVKHFKLERISSVIILSKSQRNTSSHAQAKSDIFGIDGTSETWIKLRLNLRSYLLLREEFPKSIPYLKKEEEYLFNGPVRSFNGIGRFVLGLMDSVEIVGPPKFKNYIKEKCKLMAESL